jgi:hypothetical protein
MRDIGTDSVRRISARFSIRPRKTAAFCVDGSRSPTPPAFVTVEITEATSNTERALS